MVAPAGGGRNESGGDGGCGRTRLGGLGIGNDLVKSTSANSVYVPV